jgi:hypothetical protein
MNSSRGHSCGPSCNPQESEGSLPRFSGERSCRAKFWPAPPRPKRPAHLVDDATPVGCQGVEVHIQIQGLAKSLLGFRPDQRRGLGQVIGGGGGNRTRSRPINQPADGARLLPQDLDSEPLFTVDRIRWSPLLSPGVDPSRGDILEMASENQSPKSKGNVSMGGFSVAPRRRVAGSDVVKPSPRKTAQKSDRL